MRIYFKDGDFTDLYNSDDDNLLESMETLIQERLGNDSLDLFHMFLDYIKDTMLEDIEFIKETLKELCLLRNDLENKLQKSQKISRNQIMSDFHDLKLLMDKLDEHIATIKFHVEEMM